MRRPGIVVLTVVVLLIAGGLIVLEFAAKKPTTQPSDNKTQSSNSDTSTPAAGAIAIKNRMFTPSQITVAKGGTVVWTNNDTESHTVTIDNGDGPRSEEIKPGALFEYTFTESGSYQYHCDPHPSMRGTIVVKS